MTWCNILDTLGLDPGKNVSFKYMYTSVSLKPHRLIAVATVWAKGYDLSNPNAWKDLIDDYYLY